MKDNHNHKSAPNKAFGPNDPSDYSYVPIGMDALTISVFTTF